jgi:IclR family transcriptional regulator, pca regulon regulatory protein
MAVKKRGAATRTARAAQGGRASRPPHKNDPLYNQTVEKALAILEAFGEKGRALNLNEIAAGTAMTKSSAQRCTHTLERLGYLKRDLHLKRWVLSPRALALANAYLTGHPLLEQATTHLVDLNQASGESVSLSEPDGTDMVYIARFPSRKRFFIHMPVGHRLPMYCTAAGRAYLSALPPVEALAIVRRSVLRRFTPTTTTDIDRLLALVDGARKTGYAWADQETYRGDLTIGAAILGDDGRPIAAINISGPTSRWTMQDLRDKLASVLLETARAASSGLASRLGD